MGKDMKNKAAPKSQAATGTKKKGKLGLPGQTRFKSLKEYSSHLEDQLGKMHLDALSKGGR